MLCNKVKHCFDTYICKNLFDKDFSVVAISTSLCSFQLLGWIGQETYSNKKSVYSIMQVLGWESEQMMSESEINNSFF